MKRDLDNTIISSHTALCVYEVVVDEAKGEVDRAKTDVRRQEVREARKKRGIPVRDFLARERERILSGNLPAMATSCLNECLANSEKFREQFRQAWDLDEGVAQIRSKGASVEEEGGR